jgi:riboflavin synthase
MFTGIVEEVGRIARVEPRGNGVVLAITASHVTADLRPGSSVAVQGVCQTVLDAETGGFRVAAESETLRVTTLGSLRPGDAVNLERALAANGRFDGHLVLGHVDGRGRVLAVRHADRTRVLEIEVPETLCPYVVPKGCIAVDGVSLTVGPRVDAGRFELFLIPYTWEHTSLHGLTAGAAVNIESDVVGRYVAHWLGKREAGELEPESGQTRPQAAASSGLGWDALQRAFGRSGS